MNKLSWHTTEFWMCAVFAFVCLVIGCFRDSLALFPGALVVIAYAATRGHLKKISVKNYSIGRS